MSIRVTDESLEVLTLPTSANIRVTDEAVEVLILPTTARIHVTDESLEIFMLVAGPTTIFCRAQIIG